MMSYSSTINDTGQCVNIYQSIYNTNSSLQIYMSSKNIHFWTKWSTSKMTYHFEHRFIINHDKSYETAHRNNLQNT